MTPTLARRGARQTQTAMAPSSAFGVKVRAVRALPSGAARALGDAALLTACGSSAQASPEAVVTALYERIADGAPPGHAS